jgi:hypothetical protein
MVHSRVRHIDQCVSLLSGPLCLPAETGWPRIRSMCLPLEWTIMSTCWDWIYFSQQNYKRTRQICRKFNIIALFLFFLIVYNCTMSTLESCMGSGSCETWTMQSPVYSVCQREPDLGILKVCCPFIVLLWKIYHYHLLLTIPEHCSVVHCEDFLLSMFKGLLCILFHMTMY